MVSQLHKEQASVSKGQSLLCGTSKAPSQKMKKDHLRLHLTAVSLLRKFEFEFLLYNKIILRHFRLSVSLFLFYLNIESLKSTQPLRYSIENQVLRNFY